MYLISVLLIFNFVLADYGGGYAGSGFRYGSNSRGFSLAGALVADKTPGFYAFSNPALIQYARSIQFGISKQAMSLDRSIQSFSFIKNLPPSAGMGLSIIRSGTTNIVGRNTMNEPTKIFTAQEIQGSISFGVSFGSKVGLGINIKAYFSTIAPEFIDIQSGRGIGLDIGFVYKFQRDLILGAVIKNIKDNYNWRITIDEEEYNYLESFPKIIALGISYTGLNKIGAFFQEDVVISPDKHINYRFRLGVEYRLSNLLKVRIGLKQKRGNLLLNEEKHDNNYTSSFGIGIPIKVWKRQYLHMDYALDPGSLGEGLSHLFSFSMEIK